MKSSPLINRTAAMARSRAAQSMMEEDAKISAETDAVHSEQLARALAKIASDVDDTAHDLTIVPSYSSMPPLTLVGRRTSPLEKNLKPTDFGLAIVTDEQIDLAGANISDEVSQITDRIIGKMMLNRFGELGGLLAGVELQMKGLSPETLESLSKGGLFGWFEKNVTEVRKMWMEHFQKAESGFDALKNDMHKQIGTHQQWIKDLDTLYMDNYTRYGKVVEVIKLLEKWETIGKATIAAWPEISPEDPDGPMKMQFKVDAESRLNRLQIKIDLFRRIKVVTETNGPKVRTQQQTSRSVIQVLNDTITHEIPLIKEAFATQLANLDALTGLKVVDASRNLANASLQSSAKTTADAAIASTKALNTALISNQTMDIIREQGLRTLTSISNIQIEAQKQRELDAQAMMDNQKKYLSQLQNKGAVK